MANLAVLTSLGTAGATLFCETLNHASLIDGARLARADVQRYPHGDLAALDAQLAAHTGGLKLIVTDSVFSMDGDIAPLAGLLALAERHDAWIIVDDAHGFGALGENGRGVLEHLGLRSERLIYIGTLGKAAGVAGAFVAAHATIIEHLVNTARPYIYTTAAPPAVAHALLTSLAIIAGEEGRQRRAQLGGLIATLRDGLARLAAQAGWTLGESDTAIQPLIVGDNAAALALSAALEAEGIRVGAIRPPTVPAGTARLRITLSASHTAQDVQRLLDAIARAIPHREAA
jgi:8-amino-7-oxononanoate synthase